MRLTKKDTSFCFEDSGCNLRYVGTQPLNIGINEKNIDFVEGFINKLGQLEDIEDELGIDLITLLCKHPYAKHLLYNLIHNIAFAFAPKKEEQGKTWALTKEELEK